MAILTDQQIIEYVHTHNLISPFVSTKLNTFVLDGKVTTCPSYGLSHCGYDATLQPVFKVPKNALEVRTTLDILSDDWYETYYTDRLILPPQGFCLSVTNETFNLPKEICALFLCKSTLARMGLSMPPTFMEPGWRGELVVELYNMNPFPLEIYANTGIGQMVFQDFDSEVLIPYNGKYQDQKGVQVGINP